MPKSKFSLGNEVSFGCNNDYYYAGIIIKLTSTKIVTSTGDIFRKVKGKWAMQNARCWQLYAGRIEKSEFKL